MICFPFLIFPLLIINRDISCLCWEVEKQTFPPILFLKFFQMIFCKLQSSIVYSLVSEVSQLHHTTLKSVKINICRLCRLCPIWDDYLYFLYCPIQFWVLRVLFFFHIRLVAFHTCTDQAEACTSVFFRPCPCLWLRRCYHPRRGCFCLFW